MNRVATFDEAVKLTPARRLALVITTKEFQYGRRFDWDRMRFPEAEQ